MPMSSCYVMTISVIENTQLLTCMLVGLVTMETGGGHSKNAPSCVTGVVTRWALVGVASVGILCDVVTMIGSDALVVDGRLEVTGAE